MSYVFFTLRALIILTLLNRGYAEPPEKYRQTQLGGIAITMSLERRGEITEKADWPSETISLTSQSVAVNGKTVNELLLTAHIHPDVESFTLVYALNASIRDLRKLAVPQIIIPKVDGGAKLQTFFAQGFQVWLTVEKAKKQQFGDSVEKLIKLIETVSSPDFATVKFENKLTRNEIVGSLNRSSNFLEGIAELIRERDGRPIPTVVLRDLDAETQLLTKVITARATGTGKFGKEDEETIKDVETNLARKSRAFTETAAPGDPPTQFPTVEVFVKTVQAGRPIPSLRVWYAPKLAKDQPEKFGMLTTDSLDSPAKATVYELEICFWAARDQDTTKVTNEVCQKLWLNRNIELTVLR